MESFDPESSRVTVLRVYAYDPDSELVTVVRCREQTLLVVPGCVRVLTESGGMLPFSEACLRLSIFGEILRLVSAAFAAVRSLFGC